MVKVNYDLSTGQILGFYPKTIAYKKIPEPTIEITDDQHLDCINNPGMRKVDIDANTFQIAPCALPEPTSDELLSIIRAKRNALLAECDWIALPDSPLTENKKYSWKIYRQKLRDFPAICDLENPKWPEKPI
jgi:hypothetical protein